MQKIFKLILLLIFLTITISSNAFEKISKVDEISKNLRCIICQGQSIYDS